MTLASSFFTIWFSLDLVFFIPWTLRARSFPLEDIIPPIWINLSCSFVSESKKVHKEGIFQLEIASLVAWKVDTKIEYSGLNFDRMKIINWSSLFSIPHCLRSKTSDLNLVKNPSMELKLLGLNENNSFSNWCTLISSWTPKRDSSLVHTWFGVVKPSRWKSRLGK